MCDMPEGTFYGKVRKREEEKEEDNVEAGKY